MAVSRVLLQLPANDHEPEHAASATSTLLDELQLYGHRRFEDKLAPDHCPRLPMSPARSPTSSTRWPPPVRTPVSNPTSMTCSGRRCHAEADVRDRKHAPQMTATIQQSDDLGLLFAQTA